MKHIFNWKILLGIILITLSAVFYYIHWLIFRDAHHIFIYLIGDIAFVFFEVLLVTLVLHQLLHHREKKAMLHKLNMVIGVFFSEVGTELLDILYSFDADVSSVTKELVNIKDLSEKEFGKISRTIKSHNYQIDSEKGNLDLLKNFLKEKRQFLLNLLENPNLLEHESFTDLLWAVFHLTEELVHRKTLKGLLETDYKHLSGDIKRSYRFLISEWIDYMKHLKKKYPYLFSLAVRTNPFDAAASVEVK